MAGLMPCEGVGEATSTPDSCLREAHLAGRWGGMGHAGKEVVTGTAGRKVGGAAIQLVAERTIFRGKGDEQMRCQRSGARQSSNVCTHLKLPWCRCQVAAVPLPCLWGARQVAAARNKARARGGVETAFAWKLGRQAQQQEAGQAGRCQTPTSAPQALLCPALEKQPLSPLRQRSNLHCCLWPPSRQCTSRHATPQ